MNWWSKPISWKQKVVLVNEKPSPEVIQNPAHPSSVCYTIASTRTKYRLLSMTTISSKVELLSSAGEATEDTVNTYSFKHSSGSIHNDTSSLYSQYMQLDKLHALSLYHAVMMCCYGCQEILCTSWYIGTTFKRQFGTTLVPGTEPPIKFITFLLHFHFQ